MKWENRDINVVEPSIISQFSKLHDKVTPLRLFELFFDDVLVDMVVGYIKLYNQREKVDISLKIINEKTSLFLSMLLLSRCHKLPDHKKYWETTPDAFL